MNPHETLQELKEQLSQLKPAVRIYKDVEEVALKCASAAERATDLLGHLNNAFPQSLDDFEKKAEEKMGVVASHAHQTLKAAETTISGLAKQAEASIDDAKKLVANHVNTTETTISGLAKQAETSIADAKKMIESHLAGSNVLMENLVKKTEQQLKAEQSNLREVIEKEILAYRNLVEASDKLISKINSIDFPQRLDKIDANVSAINLGIQNIQTRLENVERNLKDEIKTTRDELATINPRIEQLFQKQGAKFQGTYILLIINALLISGVLIYLIVR